jgi:GTP-binding protein HflX
MSEAREGQPARAAVILPYERSARGNVVEFAGLPRAAEARLAEAVGLAASIGVTIVHTAIIPCAPAVPRR